MLIKYADLKKGDEVIIGSNSELLYLKLLKKNRYSWTCSIRVEEQVGLNDCKYFVRQFEMDVSRHNSKYYLDGYRDIFLVKREES